MNTTALRAYHSDPAIKAKYIARIRAHRAAEHLTQGIGWEDDDVIRGCAVGCTLEAYEHERYPIELGLPEWLAHLEDSIFEGLPAAEAQAWPESFLEAITPGANLEPVRHKLALLRIDRATKLQQAALGQHGSDIDKVLQEVIGALGVVRRCHEAELGGNTCDWAAAESAASAAWSAAWSAARSAESAESAAWSVARSARSAARSAAWSAESAWSAAWSVARSAESAARSAARSAESAESAAWSVARSAESAARSAAWRQEAVDLLRLLRAEVSA